MPELRGCIHAGGHCFGLGDPVTNILLNSITLLRGEHPPPPPPPSQTPAGGWFEIASRSYRGLRAFMTAYFRYLSVTQAQRYLCLASHDLSLAIELVQHDRSRAHPPLLPDGGRIKAALTIAALEAHHPAPDVLAGLMTARYPSDLLYPVMGVVQKQEPLSTDQVREIMELLAGQWPPTPSPANIGFWFHPDSSQTAPRGCPLLEFSTPVGEDEDLVAQISIKRTQDHFGHRPHEYISKLMFRNADSIIKLSNLRMAVGKAGGSGKYGLPSSSDCDAYPCHLRYLKMHLLETIHASYIKALPDFPAAGHCYGPLDCASDIILNSIWYSIAFPLAQGAEIQLPRGILCTRALSRMESCSLTGMVAILRGTYNWDSKAICMSDHEAFGFLNDCDCNFMDTLYLNSRDIPFRDAAKAAKHPQHAAFASFFTALSLDKRNYLKGLIAEHGRISDFDWDRINKFLQMSLFPSPVSTLCSPGMSTKASGDKLTFVCSELNKVLLEYCYKHPWEPSYKLDIVCGVMESCRSFCHPKLYHVNFLVSIDEDAANDSRERKLFFAKFWGPCFSQVVQLKSSSCSPVSDYFGCTGEPLFLILKSFRVIYMLISRKHHSSHSGDIKGLVDLYSDAAISFYLGIVSIIFNELNTPTALELVLRCHLGPRTRKIEI
ncbi:hypothetical protein PVAP13_3KG123080 [Panicum virgatum]|uniref:Uncharacterized protein n=1 Tax=Panicum virgatum TaxID=38727 RepID=A0A8T0UYD7_PANVG|nr:hypothetical protein PVAP13_3KG123080 [Panicum virgatum]